MEDLIEQTKSENHLNKIHVLKYFLAKIVNY